MGKNIYLDNAATTFPKPEEVYLAADFANRNLSFNAGRGEYKESKNSFQIIENTRSKLAAIAKTSPDRVILSSSATEAANIIISGLDFVSGDNVYVSPFEHNSICRPLHLLIKNGVNIRILPFIEDTWEPDIDKIRNIFSLNTPSAIFISQISNVTGMQINYNEVFKIGREYNAVNVLDAAQGFGLIEINEKNVDFLIFAGHKSLYSIFGMGGFAAISRVELKINRAGGTGSDSKNLYMPNKPPFMFEYGSYNITSIYSASASVDWISKNNVLEKERHLTRYLYSEMSKLEKVIVYSSQSIDNHIGIISFNVKGYRPDEVGIILADEFGINVRSGLHCAPFVHDFIGSSGYNGTVRASLGFFNTISDIDSLIKALKSL